MTGKLRLVVIIIGVIGFLFIPGIVNWVSDYLFFAETGFVQVFVTALTARLGLFVATLAICFWFLRTNFSTAIRSKVPWFASLPIAETPVTLNQSNTSKIATGVSVFFAFLLASVMAGNWQAMLLYFNQVPFTQLEPVFHRDISFYVFSLPVLNLVLQLVRTLIFVALVGVGVIYFLRGSLQLINSLKGIRSGLKKIGQSARWHIGALVSLIFLLQAASIYLSRFGLLTQGKQVLYGATFTDVNVLLPILMIQLVLAVFVAVGAMVFAGSGKPGLLIGTFVLYLGAGLAKGVVPALVQRFVVTPNELVKETPYLKHHMSLTRQAYNLDIVEEKQLAADVALSGEDINNNDLTIKNVRLWDREPLLSTFSQIQEIRTYYDFNSVSNDRYVIDGELRQVMLSPRELDSNSLPTKNWINTHLTFTHGYGLTAGPVNQVTAEGLPVLFVKDLPPKSDVDGLKVDRPELYYGLIASDYVIVNTKAQEFDYPKGDEQVYTNYQGNGGVQLDSLAKRLLYTVKFGSLNILLNSDINRSSRVLYYRQIEERVRRLAPFLDFDSDPYMVVAEGKPYWVIDAYTSSSRYPYSQALALGSKRVNYVRNSVKVVVDTYEGKVNFYLADTKDPIIAAYGQVFPKMFKALSDLPESLRAHLRYPEDIFTLQTNIYTVFHMREPQIFYNKEDQWEIPSIVSPENTSEAKRLAPRHMIMKLPGEEEAEYILMLPFTPRAKDNLSAWIVARNDGENYGKLVAYSFPKDKLVFGPKQVIGRINQDAEVSRQITLWDQRGSQVIQGPLLVIPIEESLIYVRPLYLKASDGKIPELKRVIVAYENQIAMSETLEGALANIFGGETGQQARPQVQEQPSGREVISQPDLINQANRLYEEALNAQRSGSWGVYGEKIRELGEVLRNLR